MMRGHSKAAGKGQGPVPGPGLKKAKTKSAAAAPKKEEDLEFAIPVGLDSLQSARYGLHGMQSNKLLYWIVCVRLCLGRPCRRPR